MVTNLAAIECIGKECPKIIWEHCPGCGQRYKTSVRAIAEGRDLCINCRGGEYGTEADVNLCSIPIDYFKALYNFFEKFWHWINNQDRESEIAAIQSLTPIFIYAEKEILTASEEVSREEQEIRILQTLFNAYVGYKLRKTRRNYKRLFYAFWQTDNLYRG